MQRQDKIKWLCARFLLLVTAVFMLLPCGAQLYAQTTVFTDTGDQDWNNAANWSAGEPSGAVDASIGANQTAVADGGIADSYTGTLSLDNNATLQVDQVTDTNALGVGAITLNAGSEIVLLANSDYSFSSGSHQLSMAGNATLSSAYKKLFRLYSGVTGVGTLTIEGASYWFQNNNSAWSGGLIVGPGAAIRTYASGSLGSGDISAVEDSQIEINTANVIGDSATVTLSGRPWSAGGFKLSMASSDTVGGLQVVATNSMTVITGAGTLTVNGSISAEVADGASATNAAKLAGSGALTKTGEGMLVFTVHPSYTGATVIEAGSVQVDAAYIKNSSYVSLNTLGTTFTAGFGGNFADITAVQSETGAAKHFRPGGAAPAVQANDNGDGTFTITAVAASAAGTLFLFE